VTRNVPIKLPTSFGLGLTCLAAMLVVAGGSGCAGWKDALIGSPPPRLGVQAVVARPQDSILLVASGYGTLTVKVTSPGGIGTAKLWSRDGNWPDLVTVFLDGFPALANFSAIAGKTRLSCDVVRRKGAGEEAGCRLDGLPAAAPRRVEGGYLVSLPRALFAGRPDTIRLEWVDLPR
jgi:hypothetical protein